MHRLRIRTERNRRVRKEERARGIKGTKYNFFEQRRYSTTRYNRLMESLSDKYMQAKTKGERDDISKKKNFIKEHRKKIRPDDYNRYNGI